MKSGGKAGTQQGKAVKGDGTGALRTMSGSSAVLSWWICLKYAHSCDRNSVLLSANERQSKLMVGTRRKAERKEQLLHDSRPRR